jgi:DNA segregation ATPase FtsK/SpoIIIE, S-DNA-T family
MTTIVARHNSHVVKRRSWRGAYLLAEVFAVLLTLGLVYPLAPSQAWLAVAAIATPPLARVGRPDTRPIFTSAVTAPLIRRINTDAIVRAYEVAGLSSTDPKKPQLHLSFGSTMTRDSQDKGSQVIVHLPYGGTFAKVVDARPEIASGLDVAESQVYFTKDRKSERRHTLRVLDEDPLAEAAGRTPLLDCKQRSVWRKFPFGLDQFGRRVQFGLMWISLLIGARPRRGKTFALFCALDPYVNITGWAACSWPRRR